MSLFQRLKRKKPSYGLRPSDRAVISVAQDLIQDTRIHADEHALQFTSPCPPLLPPTTDFSKVTVFWSNDHRFHRHDVELCVTQILFHLLHNRLDVDGIDRAIIPLTRCVVSEKLRDGAVQYRFPDENRLIPLSMIPSSMIDCKALPSLGKKASMEATITSNYVDVPLTVIQSAPSFITPSNSVSINTSALILKNADVKDIRPRHYDMLDHMHSLLALKEAGVSITADVVFVAPRNGDRRWSEPDPLIMRNQRRIFSRIHDLCDASLLVVVDGDETVIIRDL